MNIMVNPHDAIFKSIMKSKIVAQDFFRQHLPENIKALVNFDTIKLASELLTDDKLNESVIDVIYEAEFDQNKAYFNWVIEHKSFKQDCCLWALEKKVQVMKRHRTISGDDRLPLVYVIIVYHDKKPYPFYTHLRDYIDAPRDIVDACIQSSFQLVDLNLLTDEQLKEHYYAGILQYFQKHIRDPDFMAALIAAIPWLRDLAQEGEIFRRLLVEQLLYYSMSVGCIHDYKAYQTLICEELPAIGEEMQTVLEQLKQEGKNIGLQEGKDIGIEQTRERIAKRLLSRGNLPIEEIANITDLAPNTIRELAETDKTVT